MNYFCEFFGANGFLPRVSIVPGLVVSGGPGNGLGAGGGGGGKGLLALPPINIVSRMASSRIKTSYVMVKLVGRASLRIPNERTSGLALLHMQIAMCNRSAPEVVL